MTNKKSASEIVRNLSETPMEIEGDSDTRLAQEKIADFLEDLQAMRYQEYGAKLLSKTKSDLLVLTAGFLAEELERRVDDGELGFHEEVKRSTTP